MKHVAQRGSPEFKRAMARQSALVRDLTHFRCAPDPFKGDIPWKRVQEYAREALDALHAAPASQNAPSSPALGTRIQGFGSDVGSGAAMMGFGSDSLSGSGVGRSSGGGMVGFGGPLSVPPSQGSDSMLSSISYGVKDLTDRAMGAITRPQHRLLGSMDEEDADYSYTGISSRMQGGDQIVHDRAEQSDRSAVGSGLAASVEQRLVDRITTPKGTRMTPGAEDLRGFVAAAGSMDGLALARALQKKLETGTWQETLRALCAMESLLDKGASSTAAGEVAVHFQSAPEAVRRARQSTQTSVRERAERVLKLLGDDTLPGGSTTASAAHDLLGGSDPLVGLDLQQQGPHSGAPAPVSSSAASAMDLLAGLDAPPPAPPTNATVSDDTDPWGSLLGAHAAPGAPAAQAISDPFGDWAAPTAPPLQQAHAPLAAPLSSPAPPPASGMDLLGGLSDLSLGGVSGVPGIHRHGPSVGMIPTQASHPVMPGPAPDLFSNFQTGTGPTMSPLQPPLGALGGMNGIGGGLTSSGSMGHGRTANGHVDVLSALHAATSGISSAKREDMAFDFVQGTMAELKKK